LLRARSCWRRGSLLETIRPAELLAEPLHAAGGVDELLLAREKRMASRADVDVDLRGRAASDEGIPARAVHVAGHVFGMNFGFHGKLLIRTCVTAMAVTSAE